MFSCLISKVGLIQLFQRKEVVNWSSWALIEDLITIVTERRSMRATNPAGIRVTCQKIPLVIRPEFMDLSPFHLNLGGRHTFFTSCWKFSLTIWWQGGRMPKPIISNTFTIQWLKERIQKELKDYSSDCSPRLTTVAVTFLFVALLFHVCGNSPFSTWTWV